jgi:hypothetical protein
VAAEGDADAEARLAAMVTDPPRLDPRWLWLWDAWRALQPSRPYLAAGMGGLVSMPWPWAVIEEYGQMTGCHERERQMLHQVLRDLEMLQLKHDRAEAKRAMEESSR